MKNKSMLVQALKFIGVVVAVTLIVYALLEYTPFRLVLAGYTAYASAFLLQTLGEPVELRWFENPHLIGSRFDAELIPLCWGALEVALWAGVVGATDNRSLSRRWRGFWAGLMVFLAFNPARISITLKLFDASQPFASLVTHDLLFRASLVALFVVAYAIWYFWKQ